VSREREDLSDKGDLSQKESITESQRVTFILHHSDLAPLYFLLPFLLFLLSTQSVMLRRERFAYLLLVLCILGEEQRLQPSLFLTVL